MRVIVDAMGGDNAPLAPVQGALDAHKQHGIEILLVGRAADILRCVEESGEKTLIFAVNDAHADSIVDTLRDIYKEFGISNDAIMKITGKTAGGNKKKVLQVTKQCVINMV